MALAVYIWRRSLIHLQFIIYPLFALAAGTSAGSTDETNGSWHCTSRRQLLGESWPKSEHWAGLSWALCVQVHPPLSPASRGQRPNSSWAQLRQLTAEEAEGVWTPLVSLLSLHQRAEPDWGALCSTAEPRLINQRWGQTLVMMRCKMLCSLVLYAPLNWLQGNVRSWAVIRHRRGGDTLTLHLLNARGATVQPAPVTSVSRELFDWLHRTIYTVAFPCRLALLSVPSPSQYSLIKDQAIHHFQKLTGTW